LARTYKDHTLAATAPDRTAEWPEDAVTVRAELWDKLVLNSTRAADLADASRFTVIVIQDPRFTKPLVLATNLTLPAPDVCALYRDRWPVEQVPLAAKQMLGDRARVRLRQGDLSALARTSPVGGRHFVVCGGRFAHQPHWLLGSEPAAHAWPPAARAGTDGISDRLPVAS
jgi:hypothetical protein